jgi:hypothetical protein
MEKGTQATAIKKECSECKSALDLLFSASAATLPYIERCFESTKVGSPDYFYLPKVIINLQTALEQALKILHPEMDRD